MNLFGTVLTYTAPSANYRGDSAGINRAVMQKITKGRHEYPIISPEAMRNALRETFREMKLPCNRERLHDEEQLAVKFAEYPDADKYADDFFMGWLVAVKPAERKKIVEEIEEIEERKDRGGTKFKFKRDSILRMNMAVALEPYRHNTVFTQSPQNVDSSWKNTADSVLLHRETAVTAFQYPFALNMEECRAKKDWTKALLKAIGELNNVAGNHARSYYEMSPASIVVRLTNQLVAGYDSYGFRIKEGDVHTLPEIIDGILKGDYPGNEFYLGGRIVKDMGEKDEKALKDKGVTLDRNPQRLLATVAEVALR